MERINKKLKKRIMRRIYFMFFLRKMTSSFAIETYALVSFIGFLLSLVSFKNVFANMPSVTNVPALYNFYTSAFLNTEFVVQVLFAAAAGVLFLLVKDIIKLHSTSSL